MMVGTWAAIQAIPPIVATRILSPLPSIVANAIVRQVLGELVVSHMASVAADWRIVWVVVLPPRVLQRVAAITSIVKAHRYGKVVRRTRRVIAEIVVHVDLHSKGEREVALD